MCAKFMDHFSTWEEGSTSSFHKQHLLMADCNPTIQTAFVAVFGLLTLLILKSVLEVMLST